MRRGGAVAAMLMLAACPARQRDLETWERETEAGGVTLRRIEGPVRWVADDGSLCLEVPDGWSGFLDEGGALLALQHDSGVTASVARGESPAARTGFVKVFEDAGTYRVVPLLFPAATATWASEVPGGPTIQEWIGLVDGEPVRIEVQYPWGEAVWGRQLAEGLLTGLCRP